MALRSPSCFPWMSVINGADAEQPCNDLHSVHFFWRHLSACSFLSTAAVPKVECRRRIRERDRSGRGSTRSEQTSQSSATGTRRFTMTSTISVASGAMGIRGWNPMPGSHNVCFSSLQGLFEIVVQILYHLTQRRKLLSTRQLTPRARIRKWNPYDQIDEHCSQRR